MPCRHLSQSHDRPLGVPPIADSQCERAAAGAQDQGQEMKGRKGNTQMNTIKVLLAGDLMLGRGIDQILKHPSSPQLHESFYRDARDYVQLVERQHGPMPRRVDPHHIWGDALVQIEHAAPDLRIANLETAITRHSEPWPGKGVHYRMNPANLDCIRVSGFKALSLANNHTLDWGRPGLEETLRVLNQAGVRTAGAGTDGQSAWQPAHLPLPDGGEALMFACATTSSGVPQGWAAGVTHSGIALLPDLSEATAREIAADTSHHRSDHGLVVLSIHWGANWASQGVSGAQSTPHMQVPLEHRRFARRLIDLGAADIIHGHSSHHPLPIEVYRGRLILYGCGDLINDYEGIGPRGDLRSDVSCLYFASVDRERGTLQKLHIVPMQMFRFRLVHADAQARRWVQDLMNQGGQPLGTHWVPKRVGWTLQWTRTSSKAKSTQATA